MAARVEHLLRVDLQSANRLMVEAALADVATIRRWLDGVEVVAAQRLEQLTDESPNMNPEHVIAESMRADPRHGERAVRRAAFVARMPELGEAMRRGAASGEHCDIAQAAAAQLEPEVRRQLEASDHLFARAASELTPHAFRTVVRREIRRIESDDGRARFELQRRQVSLRVWTDRETGMVRVSGQFDPESGLLLHGRLNARLEALFHGPLPSHCPDDPGAKNDFLRAHALLALIGGQGSASVGPPPRPEISIVVDHETLHAGRHADTTLHATGGVELSVDTVRRLTCLADLVPIALDERGAVLHVGRTRRLATRAQRQALRAMHPTCAVPGCAVAFDHTEPHHVRFFRDGGATDLDNLTPLCSRHHHLAHEGGWHLELQRDHTLVITLPDGTVLGTGPPATGG